MSRAEVAAYWAAGFTIGWIIETWRESCGA